jgi:hypothetical protein
MPQEISYTKKNVAQYADRITSAWHRATASIIEVGNNLIDAKKNLTPSDFRDLIRGLEDQRVMSRSTISKLMTVASNAVLTKPDFQSQLPPSYETLYKLSRQDQAVLEKKIIDGEVTTETQQREIAQIFGKSNPKVTQTRSKDEIRVLGVKNIPASDLRELKTLLKKIAKNSGVTVSGI